MKDISRLQILCIDDSPLIRRLIKDQLMSQENNMKMLIVDDDKSIVEFFKNSAIAKGSSDIDLAYSGEEAIEKVVEENYGTMQAIQDLRNQAEMIEAD